MPQNQILALVLTGVVTTTLAVTQFAVTPTNLVWTKTSDLPDTTPNDYTYEYRVQVPDSINECYHNWTASPFPEASGNTNGQIYRDGVLKPGEAAWPPEFRCDVMANFIYVRGGDQLWYRWNSMLQNWDQIDPPTAALPFPSYTVVNNVQCFDRGDEMGHDCLAPFSPIEAMLPMATGPTYFFLRARYNDLTSPDSAYLLLGVLGAPGQLRLVPIVPS